GILFRVDRRGSIRRLDLLVGVRRSMKYRAGAARVAAGIGDVQLALADRRLAHERVAEPFLPDDLAGFGLGDDDGAALGVEGDVAVLDHGRGGPVVAGLDLPDF